MSFRYWLMYLGASLLIYVVASLLNHWRMCKDPDNKTVSGSLVFILTIILGILAFPATLLLMGLVERLLMKRLFGKDLRITATHGGLECAIMGAKYPNWEMVSIGPTIVHPHSPDERVKIDTVEMVWNFLTAVLENIPVKE